MQWNPVPAWCIFFFVYIMVFFCIYFWRWSFWWKRFKWTISYVSLRTPALIHVWCGSLIILSHYNAAGLWAWKYYANDICICFVNRMFVNCKHFILRPPSPVMSENYIVFIEQPIKLDMLRFMLYRIQGKSVHRLMTWEPQCETIFHLVNRHTGKVGSG